VSHSAGLRARFGEIDIYLFDQLLKGRFDAVRTVLDAGCGSGRNLVFFLQNGFDVFATDRDDDAVRRARALAAKLAPHAPAGRVLRAAVEDMPFPDATMDAVLSSAVLHFAEDEGHFEAMLREMWRVLRPGGIFVARLASRIGVERWVEPVRGRRHRLPDGTERFLVDEHFLATHAARLGAAPLDPLKTTVVQELRAMTTWVLRKPA
jgi:SAM-dependent methyltransferase